MIRLIAARSKSKTAPQLKLRSRFKNGQSGSFQTFPDLEKSSHIAIEKSNLDHFRARYFFAEFRAAPTKGLTMKKRREKQFGEGRSIPLDRNAKARVLILAQSFLHRMPDGSGKPKGKAYGALTAKRIADRAGCARSTVDLAINALEALGILTWVNRMFRKRVLDPGMTDLLGHAMTRIRVMRTSNAYTFNDPHPCGFVERFTKSEMPSGTPTPLLPLSFLKSNVVPFDRQTAGLDHENPLHAALLRLRTALVAPKVDPKK